MSIQIEAEAFARKPALGGGFRGAGYTAFALLREQLSPRFPYRISKPFAICVCNKSNRQTILEIVNGCVDNDKVETLLQEDASL